MLTTKRKPVSVGEILIEEFMRPMGLTQAALAEAMGVVRKHVNELCNGRRSVTAADGAHPGTRVRYQSRVLAEWIVSSGAMVIEIAVRFGKTVVPLAGLEPARCRHQQILSLPRLPIPPQGQGGGS
jgi:hypothetical protein